MALLVMLVVLDTAEILEAIVPILGMAAQAAAA
jgi:hypothetical protein